MKTKLFRKKANNGRKLAKKSAFRILQYNNFKIDEYIESVENGNPVKPTDAMLWADLSVLNKPNVYAQYSSIVNSKYTSNEAFHKMIVQNKANANLNRIVEEQVGRVSKNLNYVEKVLGNYEFPLNKYHELLNEQKDRSVASRREVIENTLKENGETVDVNRYNVDYREINVMVEQQMNEIRSATDYEECKAMNEEAIANGKSAVITQKQWQWTHYGATTRHSDMQNYPVIDFESTFQVVDENTDTVDEMLYPRDTDGSPQNVYGCVCEIDYF